jgi:2'-5' RNA ligase
VHAPPDLASLQKAIDNETQHLGYASEDKAFSPHLTIGRVSQHATHEEIKRITETLKQTKALSVGAIEVDAICLFRSDLNPEGAQYTRLYTAPLSAPGV